MFKRILFSSFLVMSIIQAHVLKIDVLENKLKTKRVFVFADRRARHEDWVPQSVFFKDFIIKLQQHSNKYEFLLEDPGHQSLQTLNSWFCPAIVQLLLKSKDALNYSVPFSLRTFMQHKPFETALSLATSVLQSNKKVIVLYAQDVLAADIVSLLTYKELKDSWHILFTTEKTDPDEWQDQLFEYLK